ncbi:PAS domain S-box protein [Nocardioides ungokensis]|uniref:PAS domain S-box protein n=1 Tax=Nocardioides ungokensis TaxID=1643322 RepID=UPI0015DF8DFF|nr:PAS domain S-box protein [Nocardioides ungokensis]
MGQTPESGPAVGPQVIFGFDTTGRCTLSIGTGLSPLHVQPGELVGQNLFDVYADDLDGLAALRRAIDGESLTLEREFMDRVLAIYYEPSRDAEGRVTGVLGVTTDVTEQRRIEREVHEARHRATLLADISAALAQETLDPEAMLRLVARSVAEPVADAGSVWLRFDAGGALEPRARWCRDGVPELLERDVPADTADVRATELRPAAGPDGTTYVRVPLRSRGLLLGVVDVARSPERGDFTDSDLDLVSEIARRCALSLDNARLLEAQRAAHEELIKFEALADASDNLVAISDVDDRVVYVNPKVIRYGLDAVARDVWQVAAAVAGGDATGAIRHGLESEGRWSGDLRLTLPDRSVVGQLDAFRLTHPETGADLGSAWIAKDVTELRTTEAALREANADLKQFKALVEASPDFIAIAALDGSLKYVNPGGRELIGLDPDLDVTTTTIVDYLTPEGIKASLEVEQPAVVADGHWEGESTLRNHRGPAIPVAIASFLMRDVETGEPFALATVQRDITERLAAEKSLRELIEQRQALLSRLVDAQDAERTRIAADVHDDPVQALAAVDLRLGLMARRLRERAPDLLETLEPLQASVSGATERLRSLLFDLEPPDLHDGLTGALRRAAEEIFEGTGTRWSVDGEREPEVPDAVRAIAYRIAKEMLNNARKHADAHHVTVVITGRDGGLEVSVTDDGVGLAEPVRQTPGHRGLFTMQDRAEIAGGWCTLSTPASGGTVVTTWLPGTAPVAW